MINALSDVGLILLLSLGSTLVMWTSFLMISNKSGESMLHFIRMFVGWLLVIGGWWLL